MLAVLALTVLAVGACASDESRREEARLQREAARSARHSDVQQAHYEDDDASSEMTVSGEEGTLNAADVNGALKDHFGEIRDCFHIGKRPQRPSGRIVLRFFIDGKGEAQDVEIVESSIGNHGIERCIADIGLGVMFEPPAGHKATTFDYPVEFRPARPLTADRRKP
jgi:TonB family protein